MHRLTRFSFVFPLVLFCGILSILISLLTCGIGFAGPFETYGLGGRNIAMGGAVSAIAEDYTATHYNSAGLAFVEKPTMGFGFVYGSANLRLSGEEQAIDPIRAFQFGGSFTLNKRWLKFLKVGVAANIPTTALVRIISQDALQPNFTFYRATPHRMEIKLCVAFKIFSKLSIGGGVEILADMTFVESLQIFNPNETFVEANIPADPRFTPIVGLKFKPTDSLSFAAVYRGEISVDFVADLNLTAFDENIVPTIDVIAVSLYKPDEVVLGVSYAFKKKLIVGLDVAWMDYSKMPTTGPVYEFDVPDYVRLILSMVNPPPPNFHDIYVPRVGVEYTINEHLAVRSGYFYKPSPVPDQTGITNYVDADKHVVSVGAGVRFRDPWDLMLRPINIDAVFQVHILEHHSVRKEDPDDAVGDYTIGGEIFLGGIYFKYFF